MSWAFETAKGRDGAFRNLLRAVHGQVEARAKELSEGIGELPLRGGADKVGEIVDLLYSMIFEHAQYRHNLREQLGDYYAAEDTCEAMMIDNRELIAEHLAAVRAEARLTGQAIPATWPDVDEQWMHIGVSPNLATKASSDE